MTAVNFHLCVYPFGCILYHMKKDIHPEYKVTKVTCNGCKTAFETHATVDVINIEICSNCHPFYTGKQKLVDVAGRVDKFRARTAAAKDKADKKSATKSTKKPSNKKTLADLKS
jgi:large subunit ribosomal protein L31